MRHVHPGHTTARLRPTRAWCRCAAFCAGILVLVAGGAASAQPAVDELIGRTVRSVELVAEGRVVDEPAMTALLEPKPGQPLDMARVRHTLGSLAALGRFEDVQVDATAAEGGVALRYVATFVRRIDEIAFRGQLGLDDGELKDVLGERYGHSPSPQRASEMADVLLGALQRAGFLDAVVTHRIEPTGRETAALVFDVQSGGRFRIRRVEVSGSAPEQARLLERLRLAPGRVWDAAALENRIEREVQRLRNRGHYEARVDVTHTRLEGEALVDVAVDLQPGPVVDLTVRGDGLPAARVDDLIPIKREGTVDEDLLEDSKRRVEDYLHADGYWRASVEYVRTEQDGRLQVVFDVRRGEVYRVGELDIRGADGVPLADVSAVALSRPGTPFVEATLDADVSAIAQLYRGRGFEQVKVTRTIREAPGSGTGDTPRQVDLTIAIEEGPRTLVGAISLAGHAALDEASLRSVMRLKPGAPFHAPQLRADRNAVQLAYLNRGYPDASVATSVAWSDDRTTANISYEITEGPPAVVDHVIVTGNERTSAGTILEEAGLSTGATVGLADLEASQRRLTALGLFRRVRIDTVRDPATGRVDVVIAVEESAATTIGYGAGLEGGRRLRAEGGTGSAVERLEFAPRGFFEVGRRNLWGKNRSVSLFSRASLRRKPGSVDDPDPGGFGLYEYRIIGSFREPRVLGTTADASVSAVIEQAIRSSFSYRRRAVNADVTRHVGQTITLIGRYSFGYTNVFEERYNPSDKPLIDRLFPQVTLSTLAAVGAWDTRDDPIDPTRGMLLGVQTDLAIRGLASEVGFIKTFSQGFVYRQVPGTRVVLAGGVRLGLATGFKREAQAVDETGEPIFDDRGQPVLETVRDLPASERFYAGGDTTVRGFTLDRLGDDNTIDPAGFPKGGDAVIIGNVEARFPITRTVGGVLFLDAGNVFARAADLDLSRMRATSGFGVRYKSPVGPLRFDVGFKLDPKTFADGRRERRYAFHISIGQAF